MGLFSSDSKNKQEAEDSGHFSRDDDAALAAVAKSKRASSRGKKAEAEDPLLPEKKRARRRLVGAIALALAVAVGLPMILDSEPKPLASDIAIQIPSKDKVAPLPAPAAAPAQPAASATLDAKEEIVDPAKLASAPPKPVPAQAGTQVQAPPVAKVELAPKPAEVKPAEPKPAAKPAETKPAQKADEARALAILEGKADEKPKAEGKYTLKLGAFAKAEKIADLQTKLNGAGIKYTTRKVTSQAGELTSFAVGPFASKDESDKMVAKLKKIGLDPTVATN